MSLVSACTVFYSQLSFVGFGLCMTVALEFFIDNTEHINKSTRSKHIFEAKQQKAEDSRLKAAHDKQDRSWVTNAMGMHMEIDDAEEDESFNSKDKWKRRQEQHLSSDVSQRWASSILMMLRRSNSGRTSIQFIPQRLLDRISLPPQTAKMNHVKSLLHLQFPLANGGDLWTKDEIVQDTEHKILQLMQKAESERRARFSAQKAETASKQPMASTGLHTSAIPVAKTKVTSSILCDAMEDSENSQDSVGGDVFEESVVDATKRELCAFKSEAKCWSQTDNRPSAPSASTTSVTRMSAPHCFRNLHTYLYIYMLLLVCDLTEVFFIVWKRSFNPGCCLFLWPASRCLFLWSAFHCLTCLDLTQCRSVLSFFVFPLLVLFSLLLIVCSFTGAFEYKLNLWGVDI